MQFTADGSKEEHVVYVIAIPANRYDLLCMEGFARAIRIFLGLEQQPVNIDLILTNEPYILLSVHWLIVVVLICRCFVVWKVQPKKPCTLIHRLLHCVHMSYVLCCVV